MDLHGKFSCFYISTCFYYYPRKPKGHNELINETAATAVLVTFFKIQNRDTQKKKLNRIYGLLKLKLKKKMAFILSFLIFIVSLVI